RTGVWLKTTPATPAAASVTTQSLQRPKDNSDTVNISSQGVARAQALDAQPATNPYANTIVNFIQLQLQKDQADGASKEALSQRLAAGFEGFLKGYEDAYALLGGSGALPDEVNEALAQTKQQVTDAVAKLAEDFGIEAPASATQTDNKNPDSRAQLQKALDQLVDSTRTDNLAAAAANNNGHSALGQTRSLNLQLTTAEGDIIELIANNTSATAFANSDTEIHGRAQQSSQWSLSVQGDLNDQELSAISDFINQLDGLADEFYQGDLSQAVSFAQNIGFDNTQISAFSLSLKQVDIRRVESTYGGPQSGSSEVKNPQQSRLQLLGQWLDQLDQLRNNSLNNALPEHWLQQLSVQSLAQWYPGNEKENAFLSDYLSADSGSESQSA
ncbi:MAG TPA: DUF5610 domain-containing protein, partial [Marinagarivorans sp.]|nr:DUF5610 domain-containing protein [Marinagarivorans sp.]